MAEELLSETTHLLVGRTIQSVDASCCNKVVLHFTEGPAVALHIDCDGMGLPEVQTCVECAYPNVQSLETLAEVMPEEVFHIDEFVAERLFQEGRRTDQITPAAAGWHRKRADGSTVGPFISAQEAIRT